MSDIAWIMTENGLDVDPDGNMDGTLSTAVYLSLFAPSEWWGNAYMADEEKIQGKFDALINSNRVLDNQTRLDAEVYAKDQLAWLLKSGAKPVTVAATIPSTNMLGILIEIVGPDDTMALRYGINWKNQKVEIW